MPVLDFTASRLRWHKHIAAWSGGGRAVLRRRGSPDRDCAACVVDFQPKERVGKMIDPEDRKAMVSALVPDGSAVLSPAPDKESDSLVVFNPDGTEQPPYRITQRPGREEPTPGLVIFWSLQVRR
jgi:hypothetical protein